MTVWTYESQVFLRVIRGIPVNVIDLKWDGLSHPFTQFTTSTLVTILPNKTNLYRYRIMQSFNGSFMGKKMVLESM